MFKKYIPVIWVVILLALTIAAPVQSQAERSVWVLSAQGPLTPAMEMYLNRGLAQAARESVEVVIFQLDTPGGSIDLMNRIVQVIRVSTVPVVVYVAPRGAIAGSAGTVITLAGHAAAMAPETAIGAASPVGGQGEDLGETLAAKEKEILKATVRSLAARRGEQAISIAEATIESAKAVSANEALEVGLIDFIASDVNDLLNQLNHFEIALASGTHTLRTSNVSLVTYPQSLIEQFLQVLTNPNVIFLLLSVGVQAVLIEISSPGGWVAGFIGVVSLALGTYGLGVLPVNWFGLIFLLMSFVLFVLDIKAPTHGALTIAGVASFIVGALVLFNSPTTPSFQRVSVPLVIIVGIATAGFFMTVLTFALRAQRRPIATGTEPLLGRIGEVKSELKPRGMVQVAGELWSAEIEDGAPSVKAGERVEIVEVDGLKLIVRPETKRVHPK
jgi:membrane-bound serine protease (ClpP class)